MFINASGLFARRFDFSAEDDRYRVREESLIGVGWPNYVERPWWDDRACGWSSVLCFFSSGSPAYDMINIWSERLASVAKAQWLNE